jgi:glycosyltransferase involved in cell wall biosynthesis
MKKLSILIPVFNEEKTIIPLLGKVNKATLQHGLEREVIIIDDASTDATIELINGYVKSHPELSIRFLQQEKNSGKGNCIKRGIEIASGDFVLVQDADLEYDPDEYQTLIQPLVDDVADVVYGSRFSGGKPHRILFFWHSIGNKLLTTFSNMFTNMNLTDMESGYKVFKAEILKSIVLEETRFGFEPEVTAKIARIPNIRIYEVGISYYGRTYHEGKKINWMDGFRALYAVFKYNLFTNEKTYQPSIPLVKKNWPLYLVMLLFFLAGIILIAVAKGTGDEGDSIMHYLYARSAYQYPVHFFNHWAKPLFVFIAAPFAQFGMPGMKFFNLLCSTGTLYITFRSAQKLGIRNAWLAPLCMSFAPWMMIITLSGLTEPLFALWMITGIYWLLKKKYLTGLLWLSFLPFVRSEGLIILSVVLLYVLVKRLYRYLPLLVAGHVFYSIAGYFVHRDFLWVFNKMTYAVLYSVYGQGNWLHFYRSMPLVVGKPFCVFLVLGLVYGLIRLAGRFIFRQRMSLSNEELFLIYGMFATYFLCHTAFWALGIFNSFGLLRVLIGVLPLMGIICARGFDLLAGISSLKPYKLVLYVCILLIVIYPFLGRLYSFNWQRDFSLKADQKAEDRLATYVKQNFPDYKNHVFYFDASYISVALDISYFDPVKHRRFLHSFEDNDFPKGSFIVWDDWFATMEGQVTDKQFFADPRFEFLQSFEEKDFWGQTRTAKLFRVK